MSCSRRWASVGCRFLTHLRGPDARGGRRRRGGGGDIAAAGGLQARRGAPRLHSTSGARAAAICPRLRPCRRRHGGGSLGGDPTGRGGEDVEGDSFPSRRRSMLLIWCCCFGRSRAGKGQTNVLYFMMFKCPSWALCSLGRVDVRHTAMPGSGSTTPQWIFPPPPHSYVQSRLPECRCRRALDARQMRLATLDGHC